MGILLVSSPVTTGTRLSAPAKPNTIVTGPLSLSAPAAAGVGRFEAIIYTVAMDHLRGGDRRSLLSPSSRVAARSAGHDLESFLMHVLIAQSVNRMAPPAFWLAIG